MNWNGGRPTILVVEDDPRVRAFFVTALQETALVLEAEDGDRAVELLEQHAGRGLDLLLLDYLLPKRSGLEILRLAKARWPWIPVVLITGAGSEELAIEALRAGARDYLKKPVDLKELIQTIRVLATLDRPAGGARRHAAVDHPADPLRPSSPLQPAMDRAVAFVGEHFTEAMSLEEVARMAALSKGHFCRVFRRETGRSFRDYLRDLRIARAKVLLANPKLTVTEIAFTVGFNGLPQFDRIFRHVVGVSPTDYRKRPQSPRGRENGALHAGSPAGRDGGTRVAEAWGRVGSGPKVPVCERLSKSRP